MIDFFFFEHFRGIKSLTLSLTQKNHIIGPNGSGKTHILDMLHILTGARPLYGVYEKTSGTRAEVSF